MKIVNAVIDSINRENPCTDFPSDSQWVLTNPYDKQMIAFSVDMEASEKCIIMDKIIMDLCTHSPGYAKTLARNESLLG